MAQTNSLKAQQRKRKLIRRADARQRLRELKSAAPAQAATTPAQG